MPFPGAYATSLATVLGGQQQANQESALRMQEIQQRQLEEQLRRSQLMMQLQDAQQYQKALAGTSPEEQQYLRLGGTVKDYEARGERTTKANALADQFYQQSLDASMPMNQRLRAANLSAQLRAHPELVDTVPELAKGIGQKEPRGFLLVDPVSGAPWQGPGQAPANYIPVSEFNAKMNPARQTPVQKFGGTPIGALPGGAVMLKPDGTPFTDPRMTADDAIAQGGVMLSGAAAKQYNQSKSAEENLKVLQQAGQQVLPASVPTGLGDTARDIYVNPVKRYFLAKTDPKYAAYEHAKAGIISYVRDLANAGRINQSEMNLIVDRLNNSQTYPALQSAVDTARQIIQQDRSSLAKAGQFSRPVYDANGTVIGYTTDGKTMTPVGP